MPDATRAFFQAQRSEQGEEFILEKNLFIEYLLPLRHIPSEAMEVYCPHYRNPGPSRRPMLSWTRDLPIAGQPADVVAIVDAYAKWLSKSPVPKSFIDAEPAGFLVGAQRLERSKKTRLHSSAAHIFSRSTDPTRALS